MILTKGSRIIIVLINTVFPKSITSSGATIVYSLLIPLVKGTSNIVVRLTISRCISFNNNGSFSSLSSSRALLLFYILFRDISTILSLYKRESPRLTFLIISIIDFGIPFLLLFTVY